MNILGGELIIHGNLCLVDSEEKEYGFYLFENLLVILETVRSPLGIGKKKARQLRYRVEKRIRLSGASVNDLGNDGTCLTF